MKKTFSFFLILICLVLAGQLVFAQATEDRALEVVYPKIGGYEIEKTTTTIPEYVRYIYFSIIGISGLIALLALINAGFDYFTSAGNPEKITNAKDQIAAVFLGLIILFSSYLIVTFINPELTMLRVTSLETSIPKLFSGVWLCEKKVEIVNAWNLTREYETANSARKKEIRKNLKSIFSDIDKSCFQEATSSGTYVPEFFKKIKQGSYVYLVPLEEGKEREEYGAILYEKPDHKGKTQAVLPDVSLSLRPYERQITHIDKLSSIITLHLIRPVEAKKVYLYPSVDEKGDPEIYPNKEGKWSSWLEGPFFPSFPPYSIKMEGSDVIAILVNSKRGEYTILDASDKNLLGYEEIMEEKCDSFWKRFLGEGECRWIIVADKLTLLSGEIYMW